MVAFSSIFSSPPVLRWHWLMYFSLPHKHSAHVNLQYINFKHLRNITLKKQNFPYIKMEQNMKHLTCGNWCNNVDNLPALVDFEDKEDGDIIKGKVKCRLRSMYNETLYVATFGESSQNRFRPPRLLPGKEWGFCLRWYHSVKTTFCPQLL